MIVAYSIMLLVSILLAIGYFIFVKKKDKWFIILYTSVCLVNLGYLLISISSKDGFAIFANKIAYLGQILVISSMFMIIIKLCGYKYNKTLPIVVLSIGGVMFLLICTTGYLPIYYKEVYLEKIDGYNVLHKEYGPLHILYLIYVLTYFVTLIVLCSYSIHKKLNGSQKEAILVLFVVLGNIAMWILEKFIRWEFELLAVSYLMSELILLGLNWMMQDYIHKNNVEKNKIYGYSKNSYTVMTLSYEEKLEKILKVLPKGETLTQREEEILERILDNKKRKDIAFELHLSENTIKTHTRSLYSKLNISSREELFNIIVDEDPK